MKRFEHTILSPVGIHGRPARQIVKIAKQFTDTAITVTSRGRTASAAALLKLLLLGAKQGDTVTVSCDGPRENAAVIAMQDYFWNYL